MSVPRHLIEGFLDDGLDDQQVLALRAWLQADREHLRTFLRATSVHRALRQELVGADVRARFTTPSVRLATSRRRRPAGRWSVTHLVGPAIAACLVIIVGWLATTRQGTDRVEVIAGAATVERADKSLPLRSGGEVVEADTLHVAEHGTVSWRYVDGTVLELKGPASAVIVARGGISAGKRLSFGSGLITASVAKQPPGHPLVIVTPQAEATVVGTEFTLASGDGQTRLNVASGRVRLARLLDRASVEVASGEYAVAAAGMALEVRSQRATTVVQTALRVGGPRRNHLLGADGRRFVMKGVQVQLALFFPQIGSPYERDLHFDQVVYERAFRERAAQLDAMKANGINTVRVFIGGEIALDPNNGYRRADEGYGGFDGYVRRLVDYAAAAQARGMHVIYCYYGDDAWANDEHWFRYQKLFGAVIAALKDNPLVLYELVNSPELNDKEWVRRSNRAIDFFRAQGYVGPLIVGLNHFNNWWYEPDVEMVAQHDSQLVFSLHFAKWVGWSRTATMLANGADHAVILGECAREVNGDFGEVEALDATAAMRVLVEQGVAVGAVANGWNVRVSRPTARSNQMTDDDAALIPNSWGSGYRERFSGTLPDWLPVVAASAP